MEVSEPPLALPQSCPALSGQFHVKLPSDPMWRRGQLLAERGQCEGGASGTRRVGSNCSPTHPSSLGAHTYTTAITPPPANSLPPTCMFQPYLYSSSGAVSIELLKWEKLGSAAGWWNIRVMARRGERRCGQCSLAPSTVPGSPSAGKSQPQGEWLGGDGRGAGLNPTALQTGYIQSVGHTQPAGYSLRTPALQYELFSLQVRHTPSSSIV